MRLFSDKFVAYLKRLRITPIQLLGLNQTHIVYYPLITGKGFKNVRDVFKHTLQEDQELVDYYGGFVDSEMTTMQIAKTIAKEVNRQIYYERDRIRYGHTEYWARPIETFHGLVDDCDGYACLIVYVCRLLGVPENEIFVWTGDVNYLDGRPAGGHANVLVFDNETYEFYPLEGSFYSSLSMKEFGKVPFVLNKRYEKTWWITNDVYSLSASKMGVKMIR